MSEKEKNGEKISVDEKNDEKISGKKKIFWRRYKAVAGTEVLTQSPDGDWVRLEDAQAEIRRDMAEIGRLKEQLRHYLRAAGTATAEFSDLLLQKNAYQHSLDVADQEIARLRRDRDEWKEAALDNAIETVEGLRTDRDNAIEAVEGLRAERDEARKQIRMLGGESYQAGLEIRRLQTRVIDQRGEIGQLKDEIQIMRGERTDSGLKAEIAELQQEILHLRAENARLEDLVGEYREKGTAQAEIHDKAAYAISQALRALAPFQVATKDPVAVGQIVAVAQDGEDYVQLGHVTPPESVSFTYERVVEHKDGSTILHDAVCEEPSTVSRDGRVTWTQTQGVAKLDREKGGIVIRAKTGICNYCKHSATSEYTEPCYSCKQTEGSADRFEYDGPCGGGPCKHPEEHGLNDCTGCKYNGMDGIAGPGSGVCCSFDTCYYVPQTPDK